MAGWSAKNSTQRSSNAAVAKSEQQVKTAKKQPTPSKKRTLKLGDFVDNTKIQRATDRACLPEVSAVSASDSGATTSGRVVSPVAINTVSADQTAGRVVSPAVCKFYRTKRGCARGVRCPFSHVAEEQVSTDPVSTTAVCIEEGLAKRKQDLTEIIGTVSADQTAGSVVSPVVCKFYRTKRGCARGERCPFLHVADEQVLTDPVGPTAVYIEESLAKRAKAAEPESAPESVPDNTKAGVPESVPEAVAPESSQSRVRIVPESVPESVSEMPKAAVLETVPEAVVHETVSEALQTFVPRVRDRRQIGDEAFWTRPVAVGAIMPRLPAQRPPLRARTTSSAAVPKSVRLGFPPVPKVPPKARLQAPAASAKEASRHLPAKQLQRSSLETYSDEEGSFQPSNLSCLKEDPHRCRWCSLCACCECSCRCEAD